MIELITAWGIGKISAYAGGSIAVFCLGWLLKKTPNTKIKNFVAKWAKRTGIFVTLGLSKWKYTAPFWDKIIEPWFIDLIENVILSAVQGFILGLRSDNKKKEK